MAMERGDIGDVKVVTADYPDRVYALNPAITGFGADEMPVIAAAGRKSQPQPYANDVYSAHGASPSGAVLQYGEQEGIAMITFPAGRFLEETQYVGTKGRITIETPSHHPAAMTLRNGRPPRAGNKKSEGQASMVLDPSEGWTGDWIETHWNQDRNPSSGAFNNVQRFDYPVPTPAPITRGQPVGSRWNGERRSTRRTAPATNTAHLQYRCTAVWPPVLKRCRNGPPKSPFGSARSLTKSTVNVLIGATIPNREDSQATGRGKHQLVAPIRYLFAYSHKACRALQTRAPQQQLRHFTYHIECHLHRHRQSRVVEPEVVARIDPISR